MTLRNQLIESLLNSTRRNTEVNSVIPLCIDYKIQSLFLSEGVEDDNPLRTRDPLYKVLVIGRRDNIR